MKRFNDWWFGWQSPTALGLFRIVMGSLLFINLAMISIDFNAWFTEEGFVPSEVGRQWLQPDLRFGVLQGVSSVQVTAAVYVLTMVFTLLTALGLFTRLSSILMAIGYISLHHRNPLILHSGDTLMRMSAIYLAVAPSGAACSLDRLRQLWKGGGTNIAAPLISVWPQRVIQAQVAIVYLATFWWKMYGSLWRDGTASYYPSTLHEFDRFWVPKAVETNMFVIKAGTWGTLALELALGTFVFWKPARKWVLLGGLAMHGFIEYRYNIPLFSMVICSTYILFYEGEEIEAWAKRLGERFRRFRTKLTIPNLQPGPAAALKAADPLDLVEISSGTPLEGESNSFWRALGAWVLTPFGWKQLIRQAGKSK